MAFLPAEDGIVLRLEPAEEEILTNLLYSVLELLAEPAGPDPEPVLQRWFPDAYADDPEAAAEFRRLTEGDLVMAKRSAAAAALETLDAPASPAGDAGLRVLDLSEALAWMTALTDLRLAFGTRLGVTADTAEEVESLDEDDPRMPAFAVYDWLGFLQETLVRSMP